MQVAFRSVTGVAIFGIAAICGAIGCADTKPTSSKPAAAPPPGKAIGAADTPKQEPQVAKTTPAEDLKEEEAIKAVREKLSPEDRKLVDAQEWCVINNDEHLGGMGAPVKLTIKGEPVFICCKSCQKEAQADPEKTLAKVKELKAKKAAESKK